LQACISTDKIRLKSMCWLWSCKMSNSEPLSQYLVLVSVLVDVCVPPVWYLIVACFAV
jgi:hypothetical protein